MDFQKILEQTELAKRAVAEMKKQTRNFETVMEQTVKKAPKEHQKELDEIRALSIRALNLAKQGKGKEAEQLIKDFQHGSKNS